MITQETTTTIKNGNTSIEVSAKKNEISIYVFEGEKATKIFDEENLENIIKTTEEFLLTLKSIANETN